MILFSQIILEEQSDQGLHCLQFCLHLLDALLCGKAILGLLQQILRVSQFLGFLQYYDQNK